MRRKEVVLESLQPILEKKIEQFTDQLWNSLQQAQCLEKDWAVVDLTGRFLSFGKRNLLGRETSNDSLFC